MAKLTGGVERVLSLQEGPADHLAVGRDADCSYREAGNKSLGMVK